MERQHNLDVLKCISAFLVICIHVSFVDNGIIIRSIARVAVPIFLMISGYFYPILKQNNRRWTFLKKIVKMTIYTSLFYLFTDLLIFHNDVGLEENGLFKLFVLNSGIIWSGTHLWYFYALIYTILIVILFDKIRAKLYCMVPILLIATLFISSLSEDFLLYRNFLFMALPYFLIGCYIRDNQDSIKKSLGKVKGWNVIILFVLEVILLGLEINIYNKTGLPNYRDHYFMTTPMALTLFLGTLFVFPDRRIKYVSNIGEKYSAYIYIFHIFIKNAIQVILYNFAHVDFSKMYYINVIIIFVLTIAFVHVYLNIKKYISLIMKKR